MRVAGVGKSPVKSRIKIPSNPVFRTSIVVYSQYRVVAQGLLVAVGCSAAAADPQRVVPLRIVP